MTVNTKTQNTTEATALISATTDALRTDNTAAQAPVSIKAKCPDCDADLDVPSDTAKGEILSCPGCGLELEVKAVKRGQVDLQELTLEGEDWGE